MFSTCHVMIMRCFCNKIWHQKIKKIPPNLQQHRQNAVSVCMTPLWCLYLRMYELITHTQGQPGDAQRTVELSGWRAVGWSGVSGKLKVENEHNDQAVFILHRNHVYYTVETHSCSDIDIQEKNRGKSLIPVQHDRWLASVWDRTLLDSCNSESFL